MRRWKNEKKWKTRKKRRRTEGKGETAFGRVEEKRNRKSKKSSKRIGNNFEKRLKRQMLRKQRAQVATSKQSQSQTANSVTQGATSSIAFGQTSTSSAGWPYRNSNPISAQLKNLGNLNNDVVEQMNGFNITGKETELQRQDTEENSIIEVENTYYG